MLSFVVATMHLLFFEIYTSTLYCAGSMALSKHVAHYQAFHIIT